MELKKAYIQPLDEKDADSGPPIQVLFNPTEYTLDKSNQYQSIAIPGLSTPLTQYTSGNSQSLSMDLFFDTYEARKDVRLYTDKIYGLLEINSELHAPQRCKFIWGRFQFKATVEKVTRKFTMFLEDGTPVRATLNVTFKEYKTLAEQLGNPPRSSSDRTKIRSITKGDSLWLLASREYGDPGQWRRIAAANGIDNPIDLEPGMDIKIPPIE
jgi:hypothetical protein